MIFNPIIKDPIIFHSFLEIKLLEIFIFKIPIFKLEFHGLNFSYLFYKKFNQQLLLKNLLTQLINKMKIFSNQFIKTVLLAAICSLTLFSSSFSQSKGGFKDGYQVRRMFIYHFTRYIEWPDDSSSEDFVIGVLNDDKMYATLKKSFQDRKRKNRSIKVIKYKSTSEVKNCSILFLPKYQSKNLESLIEQFEGKNTLLITDKNGLGKKGSTINFHEVGNKLRFELNIGALEKAKLKVSGQLKQVAILI